jgi:hypothetical protein
MTQLQRLSNDSTDRMMENMLIHKDAFLSTFYKKDSVITYIIRDISLYTILFNEIKVNSIN